MLEETSWVPRAASLVLRVISRVAEACCSTAEAIAAEVWSISPTVAAMPAIASTVCRVEAWIAEIWLEISSVALAVWPARFFTSCATMVNPFPASPARAASIVAFSASRLVWVAICWIRPTTAPIRCAASSRARTVSPVWCASDTALRARSAAWVT